MTDKELSLSEERDLVFRVVFTLEQIIEQDTEECPLFGSSEGAPLGLAEFVDQLMQLADIGGRELVLVVVLMDRMAEEEDGVSLNRRNVHRVLLVAVLLLCKFGSDFFPTNRIFAQFCNISAREVNELERQMLSMLRFDLLVSKNEFSKYQACLLELDLEDLDFDTATCCSSHQSLTAIP